MGKFGSSFAIADTDLRAIGRTALPLTPPYVVRFSTSGHAVPFAFNVINPDTVLIAVTPLAPPVDKIINLIFWLEVSITFVSCLGNGKNIANVWCELHKKRNFHRSSYPF